MRISTVSLVLVAGCLTGLSACADENGNTTASPSVSPSVSAALSGPSRGATPAAAAGGTTCATYTPGGPADDFHATVTLNTQPDGLQIGDIVVGTGAAVTPHKSVTVQYTGWLDNGQVFDTSRKAGGSPATFSIDGVIKGWTEGLVGMKVCGKRRLVVPSELAYGSAGQGSIPANARLTFDIELISIT